nr:MAG TPA: Metal binding domain of Ada [Caudoviricetes sp.]
MNRINKHNHIVNAKFVFISISLEGAQSMGLTPCEKCY